MPLLEPEGRTSLIWALWWEPGLPTRARQNALAQSDMTRGMRSSQTYHSFLAFKKTRDSSVSVSSLIRPSLETDSILSASPSRLLHHVSVYASRESHTFCVGIFSEPVPCRIAGLTRTASLHLIRFKIAGSSEKGCRIFSTLQQPTKDGYFTTLLGKNTYRPGNFCIKSRRLNIDRSAWHYIVVK